MKKIKSFLAMAVAALSLLAVGCGPEDPIDVPATSLTGTSWEGLEFSEYDSDEDETVLVRKNVVTFATESTGFVVLTEMLADSASTVISTNRYDFDYTYSNGMGNLVLSDDDDGNNITYTLTVNGLGMEMVGVGGTRLSLYRKTAGSGTETLEGSVWRNFDVEEVEIDGSFYFAVNLFTWIFSTSSNGNLKNEYIVPELPGENKAIIFSFDYTYRNNAGTIRLPYQSYEFTVSGDQMNVQDGSIETRV